MPKRKADGDIVKPKKKKTKLTKYNDADPMPTSTTNLNAHITDELEFVLKDMKARGESVFKIRGLTQAIANLKQWGVKIVDEDTAKLAQRVPGVGKGTVEQIQQILENGTSDKAAQAAVNAVSSSAERGVQELLRLMGVGEKTANRLTENNVLSVSDLREAVRSHSTVPAECKVPDAALRHADWVEETSQPVDKEAAEEVRAAVEAIASLHGITSTELSGAFAREEEEATGVKLLLVKAGWHWTGDRINNIGKKANTMLNKARKIRNKRSNEDDDDEEEEDDMIPDLPAIVADLQAKGVAQADLKTLPHTADIIVVPGVTGAVEPAGVLADAGRKAQPSSSSSSSSSSSGAVPQRVKPEAAAAAADNEEEEDDVAPVDNSMLTAAATTTASSSSSSAAASALAGALPDLDAVEQADEGATVARDWKSLANNAKQEVQAAASTPAASSSSSSSSSSAAAAAAKAGDRESLLAAAQRARGWLDEKFADTLEAAGREPPYGVHVSLVLVPGNYAASARVLQSYTSDGIRALAAKAVNTGCAVSALGISVPDPDKADVNAPETDSKGRKMRPQQKASWKRDNRLKEESEHDIVDEADFWQRLGLTPEAPATRT